MAKQTAQRTREWIAGGFVTADEVGALEQMLAEDPALQARLAAKYKDTDVVTALIALVVRIRDMERKLESLRPIEHLFEGEGNLDAMDAYLQCQNGNLEPLKKRIVAGVATTLFDRAAVAKILGANTRKRQASLAEILPAGRKQAAAALGKIFGATMPIPPATIANKMKNRLGMVARPRENKRKSWVIQDRNRKIFKAYSELKRTGMTDEEIIGKLAPRFGRGDKLIGRVIADGKKGCEQHGDGVLPRLNLLKDYRRIVTRRKNAQ